MHDPADPLPDPSHLPEDAKHLGFLPVTAPELQVAASLRSDKALHKLIAWIALLVVLAGVVWGVVSAIVRT